MIARCARCQNTFLAERYGLQRCPSCSADVLVPDPDAPAQVAYAPPQMTAPPPLPAVASDVDDDATPWERRDELGFWRALGHTLQGALFDPQRFFARIGYQRTDGALSFFLLTTVLPALIGNLLTIATGDPSGQIDQMQDLYRQLGQPEMAQSLEEVKHLVSWQFSPAGLALMLVGMPLGWLLSLYVFAGLTHVMLMLMRQDDGGWAGTYKAYAYGFSPMVLGVLPGCGMLLGLTWSVALQIMALAKAHRTTAGKATAAVVGFHALFACLVCGASVAAAVFFIQSGLMPDFVVEQ